MRKLTLEARYQAVGQLMAEMPDFGPSGKPVIEKDAKARGEATMWLGRAVALLEDEGQYADAAILKGITDKLLTVVGFPNTPAERFRRHYPCPCPRGTGGARGDARQVHRSGKHV